MILPQRPAPTDQIKSPPVKAKKAITILIPFLLVTIFALARRRTTPAQKSTIAAGPATFKQREWKDKLFDDSDLEEERFCHLRRLGGRSWPFRGCTQLRFQRKDRP